MRWPPCVQVSAAFQAADLVLTLLVTGMWGLDKELNPVVRGLLERGWLGYVAFLVLKILPTVLLAYMHNQSSHRLVVLIWRSVVYYTIVIGTLAFIWNIGQLLCA